MVLKKLSVKLVLGLALVGAMVPATMRAEDAPKSDVKKADATITMELRANEAFNRGQYSLAKDLFSKVLERVRDDKAQETRTKAIEEQVRVCENNIKQLQNAVPMPANDPGAQQIETDPEKRAKHALPKDGSAYIVEIKTLGNFEYDADKGGNIPDDVKKLDGATVSIRGFMIPLDQADNISHFSLVPSLFACCFGQAPQIQHQVVVHAPKGKAVSYFPDEIICVGKLKVSEKKDDGYIVSVFEMDVASVKPAAK